MTRDHIDTAHTALTMRQVHGVAVPPVLADAVAHLATHPDQIRSRLAMGRPYAGLTPEAFERAFLLPYLLRRLARGAPLAPQLEKHLRVGDEGYGLGMHSSVRCPVTRAAYVMSHHAGLYALLGGDARTAWVVLQALEPARATDLRYNQAYLPTHRTIIDWLVTDLSRVLAYLERPDRLRRSRAQRHACTQLWAVVAQLDATVPTSRDIQPR